MSGLWLTLLGTALADPAAELLELFPPGAGDEAALRAAIVAPGLSDETLRSLAESEDWRLRHEARVVLTWREEPEAAQAVQAAVGRPTRAGTLQLVVPAVERAVPVVADRLLRETDPALRLALADALARQPGADPVVYAGLIAAEADPAVRAVLVFGWRTQRDADAALAGLALAFSDPDAGVRAQAAAAAGYRPGGAALATGLVALLRDPSPEVRALAARSLGWLKADAVGPLRAALGDPDPEVRLAALRALERLNPTEAAKAARPLRDDPDPGVARAARALAP